MLLSSQAFDKTSPRTGTLVHHRTMQHIHVPFIVHLISQDIPVGFAYELGQFELPQSVAQYGWLLPTPAEVEQAQLHDPPNDGLPHLPLSEFRFGQ